MSKLTAVQVRNAKPKDKPYKLIDGYGMHLHISKSGKKTWRYRFRLQGTESTFVLGEYPQMSLNDARVARVEARELVKNGINPAQVRRNDRATKSPTKKASENCFEAIALEWIEKQKGNWSGNHTKAVCKSLKDNVFPYVGAESIDSISPSMMLKVVERIEKRGALEIARKVLQRTHAVFMYAIRTDRATINPSASLKGALTTRKVIHHAALSKRELPKFLHDLGNAKIHISTKSGLKFLILTTARTDEVRRAVWSEIDFDDKMWRIPAKRMKMDDDHNVPLSRQAIKIIEHIGSIFGRSGYIFPAIRDYTKPMSQNTMLYAMHSLSYHSKATVHGFRSTFSTIANESGFEGDVIEKALAHEPRNRVRGAYNRSEYTEQRRELMQWWADLLETMEREYSG